MIRLYEGQIVYVKKEHLEDFIPNTFAEKYDRLYKRRAKVLEWQIDGGPGVEDPMMVRVQMLEDGEIWFLPSRMIFCLPEPPKPEIDWGRDMDGDPYTDNTYKYVNPANIGASNITMDYKNLGHFVSDAINVRHSFNKYTKSYEQSMTKGEFKAMTYVWHHHFSEDPFFNKPLKIIYNDPATIVFWRDGTKTVVKRMEKEKFNPYTAFCAALAKKIYGSNSAVNRIVNSGCNQLVGDILKAGKKAKTKEKAEEKAEPKFVRDEKGRWVSAKAKKKKK